MRKLALIALLVVGCKGPPPERWIGLDRATASCSFPAWDRATCVAGGRAYQCVMERLVWKCAELHGVAPTAEAP